MKVSSRTALAEKWHDLIDIDAAASPPATPALSIGWELYQFILDVASGRKKTRPDHWGLSHALLPFNPGPVA